MAKAMAQTPAGFNVHPKISRLLEGRVADVKDKKPVDWAVAEGLAFGSLLWISGRIPQIRPTA